MADWAERRTLALVNLASIMERADEALLPSVYREIGAALHATPTALGTLTLYRSIVQAACYPLAAYAASRHDRARVIAVGAFLWAAATFLVAISNTYFQVAISRGLNGIGLALVIPAIQSLVADSTDDNTRGTAFGWLALTSCMGSIFGNVFALMLASTTVMGIPGWRVAFHLIAFVSVVVGIMVWFFVVDPQPHQLSGMKTVWEDAKELISEAKSVVRIPSFQILVAQGVSGSFPWSAFAFTPMWLELIGFSHGETSFITTMFTVAISIGALFGGKMGDYLASRFPNSGRIVLSQISSGSAIPLAAVLLLALPQDPSTGVMHGLLFFVMGLSISWNGPATNGPIFAEIVPQRSRTSIYALDRSFESILASFAPPLVGIFAQVLYGYKPTPSNDDNNETLKIDRENATSLAKALYTAIAFPMTLCCATYSFLYCSYPRDRDRARMDSLIASELEQIEMENPSTYRNYVQVQSSYTNEENRVNTVDDTEYGKDKSESSDKSCKRLLVPQ